MLVHAADSPRIEGNTAWRDDGGGGKESRNTERMRGEEGGREVHKHKYRCAAHSIDFLN